MLDDPATVGDTVALGTVTGRAVGPPVAGGGGGCGVARWSRVAAKSSRRSSIRLHILGHSL